MARRRGELEERLRTAIAKYVRPDGGRSGGGRNKALADYLGRPASWVTEYIDGENHANLDTSLALMRFLDWTLTENLKGVVVPNLDPRFLDAMRDERLAGVVSDLLRLKQRPDLQDAIVANARSFANQFGNAPLRESAPEATPESARVVRAKVGRSRRRTTRRAG